MSTIGQEEYLQTPDGFIQQALDITIDALDSTDLATNDRYSTQLAKEIQHSFESAKEIGIVQASIGPRRIRDTDELSAGEHQGIYIMATLADGREMKINIFGGIRDLKASADKKDQVWYKAGHADRTLGIGNKPTQFNIQLINGSIITDEAWIVDSPKLVTSNIGITALRHTQPDMTTSHRLRAPIVFRDNQETGYQYKALHGGLKTFIDTALRFLP